nr:hypothetical protein CR513_12692 [Ipomoea batatas]
MRFGGKPWRPVASEETMICGGDCCWLLTIPAVPNGSVPWGWTGDSSSSMGSLSYAAFPKDAAMIMTGPEAIKGPTTLPPTTCPCPPASDDGAGRRRLPESDVGDGAAAAENADAALAAGGEAGNAVLNIAAVGYFHDVGSEGVGAVTCDDDRRLRLVLRAGWPPSRLPPRLIPPGISGTRR